MERCIQIVDVWSSGVPEAGCWHADVEIWSFGGAIQCVDVEVWRCGSLEARCKRADMEV